MNIRTIRKHLICMILLIIYYGYDVTSAECRDRRKLCLKWCCRKSEFFSLATHQCKKIPENANVTWTKKLQLSNQYYKSVNVLQDFEHEVQSPCIRPTRIEEMEDYEILKVIHIFGDYCFTPHYMKGARKYILMFLHRRCMAVKEEPSIQEKQVHAIKKSYLIKYFAGAILTSLLILPTIIIYMAIKELRENIQSKLFVCYGITMLIPALARMPVIYHYFYPFLNDIHIGIIKQISFYFGISSMHWANVICYEMRRRFQHAIIESDLKKDRKRFVWYSIYVWGVAFLLSLAKWMSVIWRLELMKLVVIPFLTINSIVFLTMSINICRTRLRVANMKERNHSVSKNVKIILRLLALMGLPQISYYLVILFSELYVKSFMTKRFIINVVYILYGFLMFSLFVMRRSVRDILKSRFCCCCFKHKEEFGSTDNV